MVRADRNASGARAGEVGVVRDVGGERAGGCADEREFLAGVRDTGPIDRALVVADVDAVEICRPGVGVGDGVGDGAGDGVGEGMGVGVAVGDGFGVGDGAGVGVGVA